MTDANSEIIQKELAIATLTERTVRGALKIVVDTSKSIVRAGEPFSVFVTIENPFDIPIVIRSTETHLPIELRDLFGEYLKRKDLSNSRKKMLSDIQGFWQRLGKRLSLAWEDLISALFTRFTPARSHKHIAPKKAL